jgi:Transposase DDE domain
MYTIAFEDGGEQEQTVSAFLMLVLEYGQEIGLLGLYGLLDRLLHVAMKTVRYCPLYKAQTIIASLVLGCACTKAINETLGAEEAAANYLGMSRFPDQSQINRYLTRFSAVNVEELGQVHAQVLRQQSQARGAAGLVVDIDQCGLVADGQSYEFHRKGYFPRKRGMAGYQLSLAYCGAYEEAIQLYLDPGNVHCTERLGELLREVDRLFGPEETSAEVICRLDAGYDSADRRDSLAQRPGYVVLKGAQPDLAARLAQGVRVQDWRPVADDVHGTEVPPDASGLRRLVYEVHQADGRVDYALLYANLPANAWSVGRIFTFYNERVTIEAFFATARHVYNIQNLRSRKFLAIFAFLRFVILTHNLLHWAKEARLAQSALRTATTRQLVGSLTRVRARVSWDGRWHLRILRPYVHPSRDHAPASPWAAWLIDALIQPPRPVQLPLPFARLHKT